MKEKNSFFKYEGVNYLLPFILITACFALWGFANDVTNPMVKAFSKIFRMSVTQGTLTQVAFYGGYFAMALPAALFIRRFSYKSGILMGLGLYATGAFLFIAARSTGSYWPFLIAYFILTCGLSELRAVVQPHRIPVRNVCGDELHPGAPEPDGLRRPGHPVRCGVRGDEAVRPRDPHHPVRGHRHRHRSDVPADPAEEDAGGPRGELPDGGRLAEAAHRHPPLPRRRAGAVLLCGRADHVLDLHHPVRDPDLHGARDERSTTSPR